MNNKVIASMIVVAFVIGLAFGSAFFPQTLTHTTSTAAANPISVTTINSGIYVTYYTTLSCSGCTGIGAVNFVYSLSVYYAGGPWVLHYWVENYTGTRNSVSGSLIGSGSSDIWVSLYATGQYTLCAVAEKGPNDIPLTLRLFNQNATTTASNQYVEVCGAMGP